GPWRCSKGVRKNLAEVAVRKCNEFNARSACDSLLAGSNWQGHVSDAGRLCRVRTLDYPRARPRWPTRHGVQRRLHASVMPRLSRGLGQQNVKAWMAGTQARNGSEREGSFRLFRCANPGYALTAAMKGEAS